MFNVNLLMRISCGYYQQKFKFVLIQREGSVIVIIEIALLEFL